MAEERGFGDAGKVEKHLKEAETPVSEAAKEVNEEAFKKVTISSTEGKPEKEKTNVKKNLRDPNKGNGLDLEKYSWTQSLEHVNVEVPVDRDTKSNFVYCKLTTNFLKVGLKGEPPIIDGELFQSVKVDGCFWNLEGTTISLLLTKHNEMEWWKSLIKGHPEIDIQKILPENNELSDSDLSTQSSDLDLDHLVTIHSDLDLKTLLSEWERENQQTEENVMQQESHMSLSTSNEIQKEEILKKSIAEHPEMDLKRKGKASLGDYSRQ